MTDFQRDVLAVIGRQSGPQRYSQICVELGRSTAVHVAVAVRFLAGEKLCSIRKVQGVDWVYKKEGE